MNGWFLIASAFIFSTCTGAPGKESVTEDLIAQLQNYMHVLQVEKGQNEVSEHKQARSGLSMRQTDRKIEGSFVENGRGIYFMCEDDGTGKGKILLTNIEGETLIYIVQLREELILVAGKNGALLYDYAGGDVYTVPPSRLIIALSTAEEATSLDHLLTHLQTIDEEDGIERLKEFLEFADTGTILAAARAMKNDIKMNRRSQSQLSLRVLLTFILRLLPEDAAILSDHHNLADHFAHSSQATEACTSFSTTCPVGECPFRQSGNNCFGMCGRQCNCWEFLCGDCCVHRGCLEHDACCARGGIWAFLRCNIPIGFNCDGRFRC